MDRHLYASIIYNGVKSKILPCINNEYISVCVHTLTHTHDMCVTSKFIRFYIYLFISAMPCSIVYKYNAPKICKKRGKDPRADERESPLQWSYFECDAIFVWLPLIYYPSASDPSDSASNCSSKLAIN